MHTSVPIRFDILMIMITLTVCLARLLDGEGLEFSKSVKRVGYKFCNKKGVFVKRVGENIKGVDKATNWKLNVFTYNFIVVSNSNKFYAWSQIEYNIHSHIIMNSYIN